MDQSPEPLAEPAASAAVDWAEMPASLWVGGAVSGTDTESSATAYLWPPCPIVNILTKIGSGVVSCAMFSRRQHAVRSWLANTMYAGASDRKPNGSPAQCCPINIACVHTTHHSLMSSAIFILLGMPTLHHWLWMEEGGNRLWQNSFGLSMHSA